MTGCTSQRIYCGYDIAQEGADTRGLPLHIDAAMGRTPHEYLLVAQALLADGVR